MIKMYNNNVRSYNEVKQPQIIKRGDIYWVDLPRIPNSSIQAGKHPCIVIQNDVGNKFSPNCQVATFTSQMGKAKLPTQRFIEPNNLNGLYKNSMLLGETVTNVPKSAIGDFIGIMDEESMKVVDHLISIQLGLVSPYIDEEQVNKMMFHIKEFNYRYTKYNDEFFKDNRDEKVRELVEYCNLYNRNPRFYLKDLQNLIDEVYENDYNNKRKYA